MSKMPLEIELGILQKTTPSLKIDKETQSLEQWQSVAKEKLTDLLGLEFFEKCKSDVIIRNFEENEKFSNMYFEFKSEENYYVPCHLVLPKGVKDPPVMICLQGHGTGMHISLGIAKYEYDDKKPNNGDRDFALQAVERQFAALTIEQRGFGIRGGDPKPVCNLPSRVALLTGRTVIGARVWDVMRAIDVLESGFSDKVDTNKIYCMGNSGGGTTTIYASALESRIKGAICSCAFCTYEDSIGNKTHCPCNYIPNICRYFDMAEIGALSAPKPFVIVSGADDEIFPAYTAYQEFLRLKNDYYSLSEYPDNVRHLVGEEGHRFYADIGWREFLSLL